MTDRKDDTAKPGRPAPTEREAKLAEALRANLRRRKAAASEKAPKAED